MVVITLSPPLLLIPLSVGDGAPEPSSHHQFCWALTLVPCAADYFVWKESTYLSTLRSLAAIAEPRSALSPMEKAETGSLLGGFLFCFLDFVIEKVHCFHHLGDATPQIKQIVNKSRPWLFVPREKRTS